MTAQARAIPYFSSDRADDDAFVRRARAASFHGAVGEVLWEAAEPPTLLVGCGIRAELTDAALRRAFAEAGRHLGHLAEVEIDLVAIEPELLDPAARDKAAAEGVVLGAYRFDEHVTDASETDTRWMPASPSEAWGRGLAIAAAVCGVRDLVNEPANVITPTTLAARIAELGASSGLAVAVHDETWLEEAGAGGVLAIGRGSAEPPRFVEIVHPGDGGEVDLCLVGKGVTFDSGGLSLKGPDAQIGMQYDMAAVATIAYAMTFLPVVAPELHVRAYCPLVENLPGPHSTKPGDIVTARNGKTIEILNTDFEGRTILADALALAAEQSPRHLIDLATLTYGAVNALGPRTAALFGRGEAPDLLRAAADTADEPVWPLPLLEYMMPLIRSRAADVRNFPYEPTARASTAAMFLREFIGETSSWAHLDFAGPGWSNDTHELTGPGATGFAMRTLVELFGALAAAD